MKYASGLVAAAIVALAVVTTAAAEPQLVGEYQATRLIQIKLINKGKSTWPKVTIFGDHDVIDPVPANGSDSIYFAMDLEGPGTKVEYEVQKTLGIRMVNTGTTTWKKCTVSLHGHLSDFDELKPNAVMRAMFDEDADTSTEIKGFELKCANSARPVPLTYVSRAETKRRDAAREAAASQSDDDDSSSSSSSSTPSKAPPSHTRKGLEHGRMCDKGPQCDSGVCKMETKNLGRCQ